MSYKVKIEPLGETIEISEDQTLLDAALRAGVYLPHACGHGLCAACKVDVLDGEVDHRDSSSFALMDMERDEGKCLACCATATSDLVIEANIEQDEDSENYPVRDFTGVVSKIETLSPRIKSIFLAIQNDGINFQAGHYVNLNIPSLGKTPRAFSIASPPSENNLIEINVALVEGGEVTTWLHNELKIGTELKFSGPYGRFYIRKSKPEPMLFLTSGSGLSSSKSMILDLFEKGETRPITLIYGALNQEELYYRELFEELQQENDNFTYLPVLSEEPENSDWTGARGKVHQAADKYFDGKFAGHKAYLCGSLSMIEDCISTLMAGRLFEKDMYLEVFYSQSGKEDIPKSPLFKKF